MRDRAFLPIAVLLLCLAGGCSRAAADETTYKGGIFPDAQTLAKLEKAYSPVRFNLLTSYEFQSGMKLPAEVRALDGKKIAIDGFVMQTANTKEGLSEFLLINYFDGCCWGAFTSINQAITVAVDKPGARIQEYELVRVYGTLSVGERLNAGQTVDVYRMTADAIKRASE